jgi:ABC-type multidrug transport system fused ATPase/permease subunit
VTALGIQTCSSGSYLDGKHSTVLYLRICEVTLLFSHGLALICIRRRPDVFHNGRLVDRCYTDSLLKRMTWSWCNEILKVGLRKDDLDFQDLPGPSRVIRAKDTTLDWQGYEQNKPLWRSIILSHRSRFVLQWTLMIIGSFLDLAPQWCVLNFLRILEHRASEGASENDAWPWVIGIALTMTAQSWTESFSAWISSAELCIPVRAQLSSLIYAKSMARQKPKNGTRSNNRAEEANGNDEKEIDIDGDNFSTINIFGSDVRRVSDFCSFNRYLPGSICKFVLSCVFLLHLLGWRPLLSGLCAILVITPINAIYSSKYARVQDQLMKARDEKVGFVSEALSGLRHIKFSALELDWEIKIGKLRENELCRIAEAFFYDVVLTGCWIASPVLLATVCLGVYAWIHGHLSPSIAFVSLGVFDGLQVALSFVPELMTMFYDAWISSRRIDAYLKCPEVENSIENTEEITFDNATIAWPADPGDQISNRFVLRNLSLRFPKDQLSIISGQTGSGKSLLLAAILGDADIITGRVGVPKARIIDRSHTTNDEFGNWIIPNRVAFVAQTAWLENKTIKQNILFGSPYNEDRYHKTIDACALNPDLEMMEDGDNTEIGPNGTNLSGGQKCRITVARAIYSRADILVFDDIFSAVDVHVGRKILENCLNGDLGVGRTRIVATHHVELCRPYAKYTCHLADGSVACVTASPQYYAIRAAHTTTNTISLESGPDGEVVTKAPSEEPRGRRVVEEESRANGAVEKHVYLAFMEASGGRFFWCSIILFFVIVQALVIGRSWWLGIWTGSYEKEAIGEIARITNFAIPHNIHQYLFVQATQLTQLPSYSLNFYLAIYIFLSLSSALLRTVRLYYMFSSSIRASRELFRKLNFAVLRAPLRWLDTVPRGRILNRYTADFHSIDTHLARSLEFGLSSLFNVAGIVLAGLFVSPIILAAAGILTLTSIFYARYYLHCARPVKRIESIMRSPVFEHFDSTLNGVTTIRAFSKVLEYTRQMYKSLDNWSITTWHLELFKQWMAWRISILGSLFASSTAVVILLDPSVDAALAGFALTFALEIARAIL